MLDYFMKKKGKPFTFFIFSLFAYILFSLSTLFAIKVCMEWYGILIGAFLMLIAIPVHIFAKKRKFLYVLSYILNTVGSGFIASAYYLVKHLAVVPQSVFLPMLIPASISLIAYLLSRFIPHNRNNSISVFSILTVVLTVSTFVLLIIFAVKWIKHGYAFYSFAFFDTVLTLFYVTVCAVTTVERDGLVIRDISLGSFGGLLIIAFVVLTIITEGEILDGFIDGIFDFGLPDNSSVKK